MFFPRPIIFLSFYHINLSSCNFLASVNVLTTKQIMKFRQSVKDYVILSGNYMIWKVIKLWYMLSFYAGYDTYTFCDIK